MNFQVYTAVVLFSLLRSLTNFLDFLGSLFFWFFKEYFLDSCSYLKKKKSLKVYFHVYFQI